MSELRDGDKGDFAAAALVERIVREAYGSRVSTDIQPLQWSIIRYLVQTPQERRTMSWVRSFLGLTHAPVVRAISTLVKRGLVEQSPNPNDARSSILELTEKGIEVAKSDPLNEVVVSIRQLPEEDRMRFRYLIREIAMNQSAGKHRS